MEVRAESNFFDLISTVTGFGYQRKCRSGAERCARKGERPLCLFVRKKVSRATCGCWGSSPVRIYCCLMRASCVSQRSAPIRRYHSWSRWLSSLGGGLETAALRCTLHSQPSRVISACHPGLPTDTLRPTRIAHCLGQGPDSSGRGNESGVVLT